MAHHARQQQQLQQQQPYICAQTSEQNDINKLSQPVNCLERSTYLRTAAACRTWEGRLKVSELENVRIQCCQNIILCLTVSELKSVLIFNPKVSEYKSVSESVRL